jgi:hypothetical protein
MPRVTARLSLTGTKEATDGNDVRPVVEKRIGSIRAEKYIARRAHSLGEPVGGRLAVKRRGAHWTSGDAIGSRSTPASGTAARETKLRGARTAGWAALRPKKTAHYTRANLVTLRRGRRLICVFAYLYPENARRLQLTATRRR